MKRILIKIGTKVLTTESNQLDLNNLRRLVSQIASLIYEQKLECIVVSSGSITCGSESLFTLPSSIPEKQAAASVGQLLLLNQYHQFFAQNSIQIGQILLTRHIIDNLKKQDNVRNTISTLLSRNVVPIINENDSVSTDEIEFGDNDILTSIVAPLVNVDCVLILTDTNGVYDKDPEVYGDKAQLIPLIHHISDKDIDRMPDSTHSKSKGGMKSKLISAKTCLEHNIPTVIANGRHTLTLTDILIHKKSGTWFTPKKRG